MKEFKIRTTLNRVKDWHLFTLRKNGKINDDFDILTKRENWFEDHNGNAVNCMNLGGVGNVIKDKRAIVWVQDYKDIKFVPCSGCPFKAKSEKDCGICTSDGGDYSFYTQCDKYSYTSVTGGDYNSSSPWKAPGMRIQDFIK